MLVTRLWEEGESGTDLDCEGGFADAAVAEDYETVDVFFHLECMLWCLLVYI